jgi:hypothetical protein
MRPVHVTIDVPAHPTTVYDYLDVLANHERFTDHMLRDWHYDGPERGIGARARFTAVAAGRTEAVSLEVIEAVPSTRSVERNTGAGGRVATGTYTLVPLPTGGTRITFEYAWQTAPLSERLAAPLTRAVMRRGSQRALQRLAAELEHLPGAIPNSEFSA